MRGIGIPEMVIVAGLLIVLIAGFLPTSKDMGQNEVLLMSKQVGPLGSQGYEYSHLPLANKLVLSKGIGGSPLLTQSGPIEIAKGVITAQEHAVEFTVPLDVQEDLSSTTMSFEVSETNGYGPLKISLNGEEVWSDYISPGEEKSINLPVKLISSSNDIRITAGSSGWKIWSPTYYMLENLQIREKLTSGDEKTFDFELSDEQLEKFYMGRVYIGNVKSQLQGELAFILNDGTLIFRGVPGQGSFVNTFSSGVKEENTLTIRLLENGQYELSNMEIVVFTSSNNTAGFSTKFSIPQSELSRMRAGTTEGIVELNIIEADDKPLNVILSGETEELLYGGMADEGRLSLRFTGYEVSTENELVIRSSGNYEVGSVEVKLVKK